MPAKDPEARRAQARAWRAKNPDYHKRQYQKHREKRLAAKKAAYDPVKAREKNQSYYATNRPALVDYARDYRTRNAAEVNAKAKAHYHANREEISERRKGYRAKHYAKIYAAIKGWRKRNPEKEMLYHAKRLIAEQTGLAFRDIPDDVAGAKIVQLEISRWVRNAKAMEARQGRDGEAGSVGDDSAAPEGFAQNTPTGDPNA